MYYSTQATLRAVIAPLVVEHNLGWKIYLQVGHGTHWNDMGTLTGAERIRAPIVIARVDSRE